MGSFGAAIRARRTKLSLSLQDVADAAGITKTHVWDMEQGRSINPCVGTLRGLSVALKINVLTLAKLAFADLNN